MKLADGLAFEAKCFGEVCGTEDMKILPACTLPLTGVGVVDRIITDLAVMDVVPEGLKVIELAPGVTREFLQSKTGVTLL